MQDQRLFVTGHTGFKGAWLSLLATAQGASVCGLSLPAEPGSLVDSAGLRGRWPEVLGDITEPGVVAHALAEFQPNMVVHLAAQSLVRAAFADPLTTFSTNALGTARVLDACLRSASVRQVLIVTTDKVYGDPHTEGTAHDAFTESHPLAATDPYGASKVAAEAAAAAWRSVARHQPHPRDDLTIVSVRAGNVVGGGDTAADRLLPDLMRSFQLGVAARVRHPHSIRPWQHVLDPLSGYLTVLNTLNAGGQVPEALNFGPSQAEPDLTVAQACDLAAARWGDGAAWRREPDSGPPETAVLRLDSSRAGEVLGWTPRWSGTEAIERTVDWWRAVSAGQSPLSACERDIDDFLAAR